MAVGLSVGAGDEVTLLTAVAVDVVEGVKLADGLEEGDEVVEAVAVGVDVCVGSAVSVKASVGVDDGSGVSVGVSEGSSVEVGVEVGVADGSRVFVGATVGMAARSAITNSPSPSAYPQIVADATEDDPGSVMTIQSNPLFQKRSIEGGFA